MWCVQARTLRDYEMAGVLGIIVPVRNVPVNRGVRPFLGRPNKAMFDGIGPTIPNMRREIRIVPDMMFPIPALPDAPLATQDMRWPQGARRHVPRKTCLDQPPARWIIGILCGQGQDAMQMVGQDHPGVDRKGALSPCLSHRAAEQIDVIHQQAAATMGQRDSEKDPSTKDKGAAIIRHAPNVHGFG